MDCDDMPDFVVGAKRMFGPKEFTAESQALLQPYVLPESWGGLTFFAGVPVAVAQEAYRRMAAAAVGDGYFPLEPGDEVVVAAAGCGSGKVTLAGMMVDIARHDERIEFREVHVDFDTMPPRSEMDELATWLSSCDLDVTFDSFPDGHRITGFGVVPD